jgi:hypothetical protein
MTPDSTTVDFFAVRAHPWLLLFGLARAPRLPVAHAHSGGPRAAGDVGQTVTVPGQRSSDWRSSYQSPRSGGR